MLLGFSLLKLLLTNASSVSIVRDTYRCRPIMLSVVLCCNSHNLHLLCSCPNKICMCLEKNVLFLISYLIILLEYIHISSINCTSMLGAFRS